MSNALTATDLRKRFGSRAVLDGVDLRVPKGSVFALLGDNGAGKTTLLSCVEGLLPLDGGRVEIEGSVGAQLQSGSLPEHIRGDEALRLFAAWNGSAGRSQVRDALGVDEFARRQYGEMSVGQRRRLHLALALQADPDILILDEPSAGLDARGRADLHDFIRTLRNRGKTVLLATHDMAEAESLCDRLAILREGKTAFEGTAEELGELFGRQFRIRVRTDRDSRELLAEDISRALARVMEECSRGGEVIESVRADRGSLEEHFLRVAKEEPS